MLKVQVVDAVWVSMEDKFFWTAKIDFTQNYFQKVLAHIEHVSPRNNFFQKNFVHCVNFSRDLMLSIKVSKYKTPKGARKQIENIKYM